MEENLRLILHGCKLTRELQENLPNLANSPDLIAKLSEEIIAVFSEVRDRVHVLGHHPIMGPVAAQAEEHIGVGIQPWLITTGSAASSSRDRAVGLLNRSDGSMHGHDSGKMKGMLHMRQQESDSELIMGVGSLRVRTGGEDQLQPPVNAPNSIRTSSSQTHRKRSNSENEKIVKRVAAPLMGNLDVPPEDGYTWRKYGQKEIMGSTHPRSYYRCTHQKFYNCPAKKQVQRLNNDPFTFEVTYRGGHTCHMSSTAPSAAAPPPDQGSLPLTAMQLPPPFSTPLPTAGHWLSMQVFHDLGGGVSAGASSNSMAVGSGGGAGGLSSGNRFHDFQLPVADMADAMFNSNSSSSNSMDLIFSASMEDKFWDSELNKDSDN